MRIPVSAVIFLFILSLSASGANASEAGKAPVVIRKIKKYRAHSEVDLSGSTVEGKARTADVFYIFQRKRTDGHDAITLPNAFPEHRQPTINTLRRAVAQ